MSNLSPSPLSPLPFSLTFNSARKQKVEQPSLACELSLSALSQDHPAMALGRTPPMGAGLSRTPPGPGGAAPDSRGRRGGGDYSKLGAEGP